MHGYSIAMPEISMKHIQSCRRVYTGNPEHPQVAYHYGVMLCEAGRTEEGLDLIEKGYKSNLVEMEDKEAAEILKANNRPLPEKKQPK